MHTNIVIDEKLIGAAQRATGIQTKRAVAVCRCFTPIATSTRWSTIWA